MSVQAQSVASLRVGSCVSITGFGLISQAERQHLLALGLTPGTVLTVVRRAPLGDPIQVQLRDYQLMLRASDFQQFQWREVFE